MSLSLLIFFRFMIYDHETGVAYESASKYFQCGSFIEWLFKSSPITHRGAVWKDEVEGSHCQSVLRHQGTF